MFQFVSFTVKPTSINITSKPKHFASENEYSIDCEVDGSIPETDIRWTQNNRPFKRGRVSLYIELVHLRSVLRSMHIIIVRSSILSSFAWSLVTDVAHICDSCGKYTDYRW